MVTADQIREEVRSPLALLLEHHERHGASRMDAYGRVGRLIGRSPAWVQRVIGRRSDITVGGHDLLNIRAAYARLCARVEAAADAAAADNRRLREDLDAALSALGAPRPGADRHPAPAPAASAGAAHPGRAAAAAVVVARARPAADALGVTDLPLFRGADEPPR